MNYTIQKEHCKRWNAMYVSSIIYVKNVNTKWREKIKWKKNENWISHSVYVKSCMFSFKRVFYLKNFPFKYYSFVLIRFSLCANQNQCIACSYKCNSNDDFSRKTEKWNYKEKHEKEKEIIMSTHYTSTEYTCEYKISYFLVSIIGGCEAYIFTLLNIIVYFIHDKIAKRRWKEIDFSDTMMTFED